MVCGNFILIPSYPDNPPHFPDTGLALQVKMPPLESALWKHFVRDGMVISRYFKVLKFVSCSKILLVSFVMDIFLGVNYFEGAIFGGYKSFKSGIIF